MLWVRSSYSDGARRTALLFRRSRALAARHGDAISSTIRHGAASILCEEVKE